MVEAKKTSPLAEFLHKFRMTKFIGLQIYRKGATSGHELVRDLRNGSRGVKLMAFFKLIKNYLPDNFFQTKFMRNIQVSMEHDKYIFSGEMHTHGWEHVVYLLEPTNPTNTSYVIKFQMDTIAEKKSMDEFEMIAADRQSMLAVLTDAMEGIPNVDVPAKVFFICKNPINNKHALAHLMEFIRFDDEVIDPFDRDSEEKVKTFLQKYPELIPSLEEMLKRIEDLNDSGIVLDIIGKANVIMGLINEVPSVSFIDAETHSRDESVRENMNGYLYLLKILKEVKREINSKEKMKVEIA